MQQWDKKKEKNIREAGINYSKKTKKHQWAIEGYQKS